MKKGILPYHSPFRFRKEYRPRRAARRGLRPRGGESRGHKKWGAPGGAGGGRVWGREGATGTGTSVGGRGALSSSGGVARGLVEAVRMNRAAAGASALRMPARSLSAEIPT